ncbi:helix-turn-helix domain-containing protein [Desulfonema magnum]|uniref:HTH cro/C1-type domain-containing protein n=1 Tax=Desulfonema magnum TaxID=45655 RepID=A0A975BML3_9BACT|nr:hypothetical protein [Desulfonema magnum]QTA88283.1 Uncharacterized protein dnm_043250 [Desulfonema magnum]
MTLLLDEVKTAWPVVANFLTPPRSAEDYRLLQARLDQLEQETEEGGSLETLMDYLGEMLDQYELTHFQEVANIDTGDVSPGEILERFMERNGLEADDLAPIFGHTVQVSEVLAGQREITLEQLRQLHDMYGLPVNLFFRESATVLSFHKSDKRRRKINK